MYLVVILDLHFRVAEESWNGVFKRESRVTRTFLDEVGEVRDVLFPWIEEWYNTRSRHSTLDYLSSAKFERK